MPMRGVLTGNGGVTMGAMKDGFFHKYWMYIMASQTGTLYVGMTGNLFARVMQHKNGKVDGFSKKYNCTRLVYYEGHDEVHKTIQREKQVKSWRREKKIALIESINPRWQDLAENWGREVLFPGESIKKTP
jgi:putative endonuclease